MLIFRQLFDPQSSTYSYLLGDSVSREAVLIDPVFEQAPRDLALLRELGLSLAFTLETHVHADHITGASALKGRLGSRIALGAAGGAAGADRSLADRERVSFGTRFLETRSTPGHTHGCVTYVLDNESIAFTGDCLLIRGCGRTDFQNGDPGQLYRSVHSQIFVLPDSCLLYPGHDYRGLTVTSVGEEKRFNPRLGGELSEADFVGYMRNLGLPHPKLMEIAVPANLKCGQRDDSEPSETPAWGPLTFTFAGIWEVDPTWVEEHLQDLQIVDVREPEEFTGPLGHIPGAKLLPLDGVMAGATALDRDRPVVTVCRAGGRSAQAFLTLKRLGFERVANLPGGMLRWRAAGQIVEGGST